MFSAALDFEDVFGGLRFDIGPAGLKERFELGIQGRAWRDGEDECLRTMVPVGSGWSGSIQLFLSPDGEIWSSSDSEVVMRNASILHYIEQQAYQLVSPWRSPQFSVTVRPPIGEGLASAMSMKRVEAASDRYMMFWQAEGLLLQQVLFPASWKSAETEVSTRTIKGAACVIESAHQLDPRVRIDVNAAPMQQVRPTKRQRLKAPSVDSWESVPGAKRYAYGNEWSNMTGAVWVVASAGKTAIEQYRVFLSEDEEPELVTWDTFTKEGGITRDMEA